MYKKTLIKQEKEEMHLFFLPPFFSMNTQHSSKKLEKMTCHRKKPTILLHHYDAKRCLITALPNSEQLSAVTPSK